MAFERTTPTASAFTAISSAGTNFEPVLTTAYSSTQDVRLNGLDFSKEGLPYAFPSNSAYHLRLGRADSAILRIIANRDSLFVFKEDGIWRVYQSGASSWGYQKISEAELLFPDTVALMNNAIYAFARQGVIEVTEMGAEEIDLPIDDKTQAIADNILSSSTGPGPESVFGVADLNHLRYMFWYATEDAGNVADEAQIYNASLDNTPWTERDDATTGGYIGADGLLYLGSPTSNTVTRQRNSGTASDYRTPDLGPIQVHIEWLKLTNGNPSGVSQFTEIRLLTEEATEGAYDFDFTNDLGFSETVNGGAEGTAMVRVWVPDGMQRTSRLTVGVRRDVQSEYLVILGLRDMAKQHDAPISA
jgi:hypothetical protein